MPDDVLIEIVDEVYLPLVRRQGTDGPTAGTPPSSTCADNN